MSMNVSSPRKPVFVYVSRSTKKKKKKEKKQRDKEAKSPWKKREERDRGCFNWTK